jgi:galactokinase/mevalonate kinase-like predicted kinase
LASLYQLKASDESLGADKLIKEAHYFETTEQGIRGGFQDYVAAYFGGYNYIDFASLENARLSGSPTLGQRVPSAVEGFLNENMIFVIQRSENISSSTIVEDEVSNFLHSERHVAPHLQSIKNSNDAINEIFTGLVSVGWQDKLAHEINSSWEAQKRLSTLIGDGYIKELEEMVRPFVYVQRGPGAGGNSLFLLANPLRKAELIQKLNTLKDKIVVLYGRVNNQGLELSIS